MVWHEAQRCTSLVPHFIPKEPVPDYRNCTSGTASLTQLIEQYFCLFQIDGIEAFAEPVIDLGQHHARFISTPLLSERTRLSKF
jgi:hypothetical protein